MKKVKVGIDNYGLYPLELDPMGTLEWVKNHGAEGVSFSGLEPKFSDRIDADYLHDLAQFAKDNDLYIEWGGAQHIPRDMTSWAKKDLQSIIQKAAKEAELLGTRIVRSCSGGLMRWKSDNPSTDTLLRETADALSAQRQMLEDHNVILAVEIHFEFTTFELLRLFEMCEAEPGGYLGVCLDTMNLLTMLEDPVSATERILPWVVSTHIKDGGMLLGDNGLISFVTGVGDGVVDLKRIFSQLQSLTWEVNLSVEDHGGDFDIPIFNPIFMSEFPDLSTAEFAKLMAIVRKTQNRVDRGECAILDRQDWAEVCEERISRDIDEVKKII
jgi:sugar phosphate isomerase/epimerase